MIFTWLKNRRRKKILAEGFPPAWIEYLQNNVWQYAHLSPRQQVVVHDVSQVLVAEKNWVGGAELSVTDEMKVTIAAMAALLTLGYDDRYYFDRVQSIIIHPGAYAHPPELQSQYSIVEEGVPVFGESWHHGPIVLSWKHVLRDGRNHRQGRNLVLHEFAHHLDGLNGEVEGTPPIAGRQQEKRWYRVTEAEYLRLVGSARRGEATLLDHYGATSRAEFFAVATECFFEQPHAMQELHGELYSVLQDFYRQDPTRWIPLPDVPPEAAARGKGRRALAEDADAVKHSGQRPAAKSRYEAERQKLLKLTDSNSLFTIAVDYLNRGRRGLAVVALTRAIELNPADAEAYQHRADAQLELGKYPEALADAEEAIRLDPTDTAALRTQGAACVGLGQFDRGLEILNAVLKKSRGDSRAHFYRALAWAGLGKLRHAIADYGKSILGRPYFAPGYYHRGLARQALWQVKKADADLAKAFQLDPYVDRRPAV